MGKAGEAFAGNFCAPYDISREVLVHMHVHLLVLVLVLGVGAGTSAGDGGGRLLSKLQRSP